MRLNVKFKIKNLPVEKKPKLEKSESQKKDLFENGSEFV